LGWALAAFASASRAASLASEFKRASSDLPALVNVMLCSHSKCLTCECLARCWALERVLAYLEE